jgi:glycosyltransferase involved in cell wall biosynthesis
MVEPFESNRLATLPLEKSLEVILAVPFGIALTSAVVADSPPFMRSFPARLCVGGFCRLVSTSVISVANAAADNLTLMGVPRRMISVIINGVDGFRKYDANEREFCRDRLGISGCIVVGICARLEEYKDHVTFLRAARILLQKDEGFRFLIIGDGSQRESLVLLAEALGISDKVIFTGFTEDVEMYYNCLDINVNCSVGTETSSLALSEGMSIGLPSVASSFGGNPYMVRHGENGYIYEMGDFFGLAKRILEIACDRELYMRMSQNAMERFSAELNSKKMTAETEALYKKLYEERVTKRDGALSSELR